MSFHLSSGSLQKGEERIGSPQEVASNLTSISQSANLINDWRRERALFDWLKYEIVTRQS